MKNKLFNICNLYVFLWFVLKTQGILYKPVAISVASYIIIVAISLYYAIKCYISRVNPPFVKVYNVLFALFCVYGVINLFVADANSTFNHIPPDFYLQNVVQSMIPFYAFYAFAKQGLINKKWLHVFFVVFLTVTISTYYIKENSLIQNATTDVSGVTNNVGYIFVSLLPLVCFWDNKKLIQYASLIVCGFYIIMSMKRGAILIAAVVLLIFIIMTTKSSKNRKRFVNFILPIVVVIIGYQFVLYLLDTNVYFGSRVEDTLDGYSSQRDILYYYYWNMFWHDSNFLEFVLGRGADGTIHTGMNYAHNDWLEIMIDQGFVGVIIFVIFWFQLLKLWREYPKNNLKTAFDMCIASLFLRTFFSMSINDMTIYSTCILGVAVAAFYNNKYMSSLIES